MDKISLYTTHDEAFDGPENEDNSLPLVHYDPHDQTSVDQARQALRARFSLDYTPVLCNDPEPGFFTKLFTNWFGSRNDSLARPAKSFS